MDVIDCSVWSNRSLLSESFANMMQVDQKTGQNEFSSCPSLAQDEVHIWHLALEVEAARVEECCALLPEDERGRAARFHFKKDRHHFVVGHGYLRLILGRYLNLAPKQLRFTYSQYGKPALAHPSRLNFNLSHSHTAALLAVTTAANVGVDIEQIREDFPCLEVAKHFFSHREQAALAALPPEVQPQAFFDCWTRKEAYIKARGEGLSLPLDQFDVTLTPGQPAQLLHTRPEEGEARRWTLQAVPVDAGYAAAVAVEGQGWQIRSFEFNQR